ncbi:unnamed protein product [Nezara viridula]|uniref:Uncharacterized protein n=1 Tax=Nezara viridula TaxID=85310 RepID=A0A9P0GX72_NEZVI|nr:unnamed protein product [Nezara viridula]
MEPLLSSLELYNGEVGLFQIMDGRFATCSLVKYHASYGLCTERAARLKAGGTGGGGGPGGGTTRGQRPTGRGSVLTTLTSLDCARQHSLGPLPEATHPANNGTTTHGTSTV